MLDLTKIYMAMSDYEEGFARRVQHFTKVYTYATMIGQGEGMDPEALNTLQAAALMHDIGIKYGEAHFGRGDGKLQEEYGPALVEEMLLPLGAEAEVMDRIKYLVGHHHNYTDIDSLDYQILVEADFLVNMCEDDMPKKKVMAIYRKIFRTETGRSLCRSMFALSDDPIVMGVDNHVTTFSHRRMDKGIYGIQCPGFLPGPGRLPGWGYVLSYLIIGKEKALLIDTGFGNEDLKAYIEGHITTLPLMVVNTHVHPDHSGSNPQFDVVYVGEHEVTSPDGVYFYREPSGRPACQAVLEGGEYHFEFLKDGEKLDLGGRMVQVVEIPGHTSGSIAFFDEKTRILFSGDALLKRVLMGGQIPLSTYREALVKASALPIRDIFSAHWPEPLGPKYVQRMIDLIDIFDPADSEFAGWEFPDGRKMDLRMVFTGGDNFDDDGFIALGYFQHDLDVLLGK